ncbi:MAG: PQQ-binding-like beta-propeller repeat protein [Kiritimatiellae bacterium]|nr:PQQ-binding-like beta-propeller repeat protein [Kiritimatiellia bacterium]MDD5520584.1 PQQ-binding-like beta-propeller repeat protein [Kiritimatiellia bacterium]
MFKRLRITALTVVMFTYSQFNGWTAEQGNTTGTNALQFWPVYHGDAALRGIAGTTLSEKLSVLWRFKVGAPVTVTPVVGTNRIFFIAENGETFAISMQGEKIWVAAIRQESAKTNVTQHVEKFSTQPMYVRGILLVGSDQGNLHALEADTGKTKWKYQVGENINGTANWIEPESGRGLSVIVISQADGIVHCLDLETGKPIWVSQAVSRCDGSPGVGKDFIVFGSCDAALHVLSSARGESIGRVELEGDGQVAGGVAIDGNLVFAGTRGGLAVCADARKGTIVWTNQVCYSEVFTTPAVTKSRVVFGSSDDSVFCLNRADGKKIWSFTVDGSPLSPVVAGDKVVVSAGGTLYILKLEDGRKLWTGKASDSISSPAVIDGKVVIGSDDGFIIMYGAGK